MSWFRNIVAIALPLALLAGCGFEPMYAKKNQSALATGVKIVTSNDAIGQQFHQNLEDRLNPSGLPSKPHYVLSVKVQTVTESIGVARDGTVSRFNVTLASEYVLTRLSDGKEIQRSQIDHVSSYNNQPNQYYSTYISEKDALSRGLVELSELYRQRIGALVLRLESA